MKKTNVDFDTLNSLLKKGELKSFTIPTDNENFCKGNFGIDGKSYLILQICFGAYNGSDLEQIPNYAVNDSSFGTGQANAVGNFPALPAQSQKTLMLNSCFENEFDET